MSDMAGGYSEDELRELLRDLHQRLGKPPSQTDVKKDDTTPSVTTFENTFGSWTDALAEIGLEPPAERGGRGRTCSLDEVLDALREYTDEYGHAPSTYELRDAEGYISMGTVYNYFDSWWDALIEAGVADEARGQTGVDRKKVTHEALLSEVARLADELDRMPTSTDVKQHADYSIHPYYRVWDSWSEVLADAGLRDASTDQYSNAELQTSLRRVGADLNHPPTADEYRTYREQTSGELPSARTILYRYDDSWVDALADAGFDVDLSRHTGGYEYSQEDAERALRVAICLCGGRPSRDEYVALGLSPSARTVRKRLGDWREAVSYAYERLSDAARTLLEDGPQTGSFQSAVEPIQSYQLPATLRSPVVYWLPCHSDREVVEAALDECPKLVEGSPCEALTAFEASGLDATPVLRDYYSEDRWREAFGR